MGRYKKTEMEKIARAKSLALKIMERSDKIRNASHSNPYLVARNLRELLEKYKDKPDLNTVYEKLLVFCESKRYKECEDANHNPTECMKCPVWKLKSELFYNLKE